MLITAKTYYYRVKYDKSYNLVMEGEIIDNVKTKKEAETWYQKLLSESE